MDKCTKFKWYIDIDIKFSFEGEGNPAMCNNIDEPGGHYTKWNKQDTVREIPDHLICMWNLKKLNSETIEEWLLGDGENEEILVKRYKLSVIRWISSGDLMYSTVTILKMMYT